jgi:hypothetical protein
MVYCLKYVTAELTHFCFSGLKMTIIKNYELEIRKAVSVSVSYEV